MSPAADRGRSIYRPPWRLDLTLRAGVTSPLSGAALARVAVAALEVAGAPRPASIGLVLTDDEELAALNETHLGVTGPTDVLSFPLLPPKSFPPHEGTAAARDDRSPSFALPPGVRRHLGDVVVSIERVTEQAKRGRGGQTGDVRWSPADELRLPVIHGVLHLCGWDHAEPAEETAMRALERRLLGL